MSARKLICGNWKLHKTIAESLELATAIKNAVGPLRDVEVAVAPVFTALHAVAKRLEGSAVGAGRAGLLLGGPGRLDRRGLGASCSRTSAASTSSSATPSGGSTSASSTRRRT